ncbi:MAG TPA: DivIVA domain-containing protein [candidate division Zixibacteria bacterium]|nr:DivIVA domain-containing protein [candidate division Zixibacteria bacterium]
MSVTPNEIRNAQFPTTMRGYSRDDVDAFLQKNADSLEAALTELNTLRASHSKLSKERLKLSELEDTLKATLVDAKTAANSILDKANHEAKRIIAEAEGDAKRLFVRANEYLQEIRTQIDELANVRDNYRIRIEETIQGHLRVINEISEVQPELQRLSVEETVESTTAAVETAVAEQPESPTESAVQNEAPTEEETTDATPPVDEETPTEQPVDVTEDLHAPQVDGTIYERSFVDDIIDVTPAPSKTGPRNDITNLIATAAHEAVLNGKLTEATHSADHDTTAEDLEFYRKLSGATQSYTEPESPQPQPRPATHSSDPTANLRGPDGIIVFGRREDRERAVEQNAQVLNDLDSVVEKFAAELSALENK